MQVYARCVGGRMFAWVRAFLFCVLLGGLGACHLEDTIPRTNPYDPNYQKDLPCEKDPECGPFGFCVSKKCVQCKTAAHCPKTRPTCLAGMCR